MSVELNEILWVFTCINDTPFALNNEIILFFAMEQQLASFFIPKQLVEICIALDLESGTVSNIYRRFKFPIYS